MTTNDSRFIDKFPNTKTRRVLFSRAQTAWLGYAGTIALFALVFSLWQVEPVPSEVHLLGVVVAAICLFPLALWMARGSQGIPAFELVCLAYLLAFSTPLYLQPNRINIFSRLSTFTWEETYRTLLLVIVGLTAFIAGYYLLTLSRVNFRGLRLDLPMHPQKRLLFVKTAFGIGLGMVALRAAGLDLSAGGFNSLVNQIQNLVYVAITLLGYRVFRDQEHKRWRLVLYGATALSALFGLATGLLENAIIPLLILVIVRWNVSRRVPIALLAGGLCLFVLLNSVKMAYRSQAWTQTSTLSVADRVNLWGDLAQKSLNGTNGPSDSFEDTFRHSMKRFDLLHQFIRVQQLTPGSIPYFEGSTYSYLLYGWIPRFVWPDKPTAQEGNVTFALQYRFLAESQTSTTMIGIGHLPEAYANFGTTGLVFIMALQGMFLAAINKMLNGPHSEGGKAIYLSLMIFFLNGIGSSTASLFMSIPLTILLASVMLRFFATGWRAAPAAKQKTAFTAARV